MEWFAQLDLVAQIAVCVVAATAIVFGGIVLTKIFD